MTATAPRRRSVGGTRRRGVRVVMTLVTALSTGLLGAGCAGSAGTTAATDVTVNGETGWHGTPVSAGYPLPDQRFTDTDGRVVVPRDDLRSPVTLVFFGYTHCPDICNVVLANLASALRGAPGEARRATEVVFVSVDPGRDKRPVIREYLDRFDPSYVGLRAPLSTVEQAAHDLHLAYERPDGSHGGATSGYLVDHGTHTTAFVDGRARLVWSPETSVADLRADLARLASDAA